MVVFQHNFLATFVPELIRRKKIIINQDTNKTKICSFCHKEFPNTPEYFNRNKLHKRDGLETQCKICKKEVKLRRYKNIIYEIYCIPTDKYYIGQTIKPINDRISKHFSDAKRGREQPLYKDIRNYDRINFTYKEIEYVPDKENLDKREQYQIKTYINKGYNLYNIELGGRRGSIVANSTKLKQAKSKGTKPFLLYDYWGNMYGRFESITEAERKYNIKGIGSVLGGKCYHSDKYIAIYEHEFSKEKLNSIIRKLTIDKNGNVRTYVNHIGENNPMYGKGIRISQYSMDGKLLCIFNSLNEASKSINGSVANIKYHINNKTKHYKNYVWNYYN